MEERVAEKAFDNGGRPFAQAGIGRGKNRRMVPGTGSGGMVLEHFEDFRQLVVAERVEGGLKGGGVALACDGDVVEIARKEFLVAGHPEEQLLGEDFVRRLKGHLGAAGSVGRPGIEGEAAGYVDGDVSRAAVEGDVRSIVSDDEAVDGIGHSEIEGEAATRVPTEIAIRLRFDKEVDVGAVSVPPTGGERGAASQAEILLAAEGSAEGSTNRLK